MKKVRGEFYLTRLINEFIIDISGTRIDFLFGQSGENGFNNRWLEAGEKIPAQFDGDSKAVCYLLFEIKVSLRFSGVKFIPWVTYLGLLFICR